MRSKRKKEKNQGDLTSFEIWFRPIRMMEEEFDFNHPDYTIMAKSHLFAARSASKLAGRLYEKAFKGTQTTKEKANYVIRPAMLKSPRFLTFWH